MNKPIKLIYILGLGHSGSTLLDLILGSHSCIESVGEIKDFWEMTAGHSPRPEEERICTCGASINQCDYWNQARSKIRAIYGNAGFNLQSNVQARFEENNYSLMSGILEMTNKRIVCESSKDYLRLKQLLQSKLFEVFILHLVRDGRAVANSWRQRGQRIGRGEKPLYNYFRVIKYWQKLNLKAYIEFNNFDNYFCLKYEDLAIEPQKYVSKILERFSLDFESDQLQFWQFKHHNIDGNRMRLKGKQDIKVSYSFLNTLSREEWWLGTVFALPGLKLFDYPIRKQEYIKKTGKKV